MNELKGKVVVVVVVVRLRAMAVSRRDEFGRHLRIVHATVAVQHS